MNFLDFLRGIGHFVARTFGIIRKIVPEEWLVKAIGLAQQAADKFVDNAAKRQWVVGELMKIPGMSESTARLLVELAVKHLKADVIDKAAGKVVVAVSPPTDTASSTPAAGGTQ